MSLKTSAGKTGQSRQGDKAGNPRRSQETAPQGNPSSVPASAERMANKEMTAGRGAEATASGAPEGAERTSAPASAKEQIRRRAYELYLSRNGAPGDAVSDWLAAERELHEADSVRG